MENAPWWRPYFHGLETFTGPCPRLCAIGLPDILPGDDRRLILTSLDILRDGSYVMATVVMRPEAMPEDYESLLLFPWFCATTGSGGKVSLQAGLARPRLDSKILK